MEQSSTILIFDGDCGFCTACVRWGFRNFKAMPRSEAYQIADLAALGLTTQECSRAVYLVSGSQKYRGHRAVAGLLRLQPGAFWPFLGKILVLPGVSWFFALGYALVVKFRHLLPGASEQCRIDPKGM